MYSLVIFDVDGTLVTTKSGKEFRSGADDWQWLPGRLAVLKILNHLGIRIALATNQGGVAFGYMQEADMEHELQRMCEEGNIDDYRVCYNHPKATIPEYCKDDDNRKPGGGMIRDLVHCAKYISFGDTLYIGDRSEDEEAAKNTVVSFMWAKDFFGD